MGFRLHTNKLTDLFLELQKIKANLVFVKEQVDTNFKSDFQIKKEEFIFN